MIAGFCCSNGAGSHRVRAEASTLPTSLLLHLGKAQAACGDPRPPRRAKAIHPSVERLSWYHFQWEVFSQPAGSQQGGMWWGILGKIVQGIVEMLCFDGDDDYYFFPC